MATSLGELILELGLDSVKFDRQMREAERRAESFGRRLEAKTTQVAVSVDDRALTDLNRHLDSKVKHHKQVQDVFTLNPLTPKVDDRALTDLNQRLDQVKAKQREVQNLNQILRSSGSGTPTQNYSERSSSGSSSPLGNSAAVAELRAIRSELGKIRGNQNRRSSTFDMFKTGLFEGFGQSFGNLLSKEFSKSAKKNLGVNVSNAVGRSFDVVLDPSKYEGFEDKLVAKMEEYFVYTPKEKRAAKAVEYAKEFAEPVRAKAAEAANAAIKVGAYPAKIRKKVNLARSAEIARQMAEEIEVPDIDNIENIRRIALISGGVDLDGKGRNARFARNAVKGVLGADTATVPMPGVYSNDPGKLGGLFQASNVASQLAGKGSRKPLPLDKLAHLALESGLNPDAVIMQATKLAYEKKYPNKQFIFGGTSAGSVVAEEATAIAERSGDRNVKGFGLTLGMNGTTNTASPDLFKAFTGSLDPLFMAQFGTQYNKPDQFSRGERRIYDETVAGLPLPPDLMKGVFRPSDSTVVVPNAGAAHHLGQFVANPDVQQQLQSFLGLPNIKPEFTGKPGTRGAKAYADIFGQSESIERTIKALLGDLSALGEIELGGYAFTNADNTLKKTFGPDQEKSDLEYASDEFVVSKQVTGKAAEDAQRLKEIFKGLIETLGAVGKTSQSVDLDKVRQLSDQYDELYGATPKPVKGQREALTRLAQGDESDMAIDSRTIPTLEELRKQEAVARVKMRMPMDLRPLEIDQNRKQKEKQAELVAIERGQIEAPRKKGIAGVGQRASESAENALVARINALLAQIPGDRDVIENDPRQIKKLTDLKLKDYVHMSRIGGEDVAGVLGQLGGVMQGVEGVALDAIPFGRQAKAVGKNVALPAAAFAAAGQLPGGHMVTQALSGAMEAAVGLPAGALADAISGSVGSALTESIGAIPLLGPKLAPAFAQAVSGVIEAGITGGAAAIAGAAAPVVGGQALLGAGKQGLKAIAPGGEQRKEDARAIAAATKNNIKRLAEAGERAQRLLPMDSTQSGGLAGMIKGRLPGVRGRVDEALKLLPPAERMSTPEGNDLANQKAQITRLEKKLDQMLAGLRKLAADPAGEMNRAVKGDVIDVEVIDQALRQLGGQKPKRLAPATTPVKEIERQIKSLGQEFSAQASAIKFRAETDSDPDTSTQAARELLEAATVAKEAIAELVGGLGSRSTPEIKKAAGISKGQITKSSKKVSEYAREGEQIGGYVAEGLSDGIVSKIALLKNTADAMVQSLISSTEEGLEIKSPSRVFERLGEFVVEGFEVGLQGFNSAGAVIDGFVEELKNKFPALAGDIDILSDAMKVLVLGFFSFKTLAFVVPFLKDFIGQSVQVATQLEQIEVGFKFVTGSAKEAAATMDQVMSRSSQFGTNFLEDVQGKKQIAAASKGTALEGYASNELFEAGQQASSVFQLDPEKQQRVYTALEQMISKGRISAEELRQQLGEHLPGAFQIAARSIGVTTAELDKMLERGDVVSEEFLPRFAQQLKAETFSGLADSADTTQAAMNRLDTQIIRLKGSVGEGLLPAKAFAFNAAAKGMETISENAEQLISVFTSVALLMSGPFLKALLSILVRLKLIPTTLNLTRAGLLATGAAMASFAAKLILVEAAFQLARIGMAMFADASGELGGIAEQSGRGLDQLIEKLEGVENASGKARNGLKAEGFIGETTERTSVTKDVEKTLPFLGEGNIVNRVLGFNLGGYAQDKLADRKIRGQRVDRLAAVSDLAKNNRGAAEIGQSFLTGENRNVLDSYKQIEEQLKKVQLQQQAVRSSRPGSTEELEMLIEQEQRLLQQRGDIVDKVMTTRSQIDEQVASQESAIEALKADLASGAISVETYEKAMAQLGPEMLNLQKVQRGFTNELDATNNSLLEISRTLEDIADKYSDMGEVIGQQENIAIADLAARDLTPGQRQTGSQAIAQAGSQARLQANQAAIEQVRAQLAQPAIQNALSALNISDYSSVGSAQATRIAGRGDASPGLKAAGEAIQQLRQLENESAQLQQQIGESAADTREEIRNANRSVDDYYRSIQQEAQALATATELAQNELGMAQVRSDIQMAVMDVGQSFIEDFGASLIAIVEAFNKPLQDALNANQQKADAQLAYLNGQLQSQDLLRGLPGGLNVDGTFGGAGGGAGSSLLVGKMGSTGHSTGNHTHFQTNDRSELSIAEINRRFRFNGAAAPASSVSNDEHDHANRGSRGFDVAMAAGTAVTAIDAVSISPTTWSDSLGWYNEVTFADGFVIRQGHFLKPDGASAGARRAAAPAQGGGQSQRANTAPGSSSSTGAGGGSSQEAAAWNFYKSRGYSDAMAAAMVGSIRQESGFRSDVPGDKGEAMGIFQWHGDRRNSQFPYSNFNEQLAYSDQEFRGPNGSSVRGVQFNPQVQTLGEAQRIVDAAVRFGHRGDRNQYAAEALSRYGGQGANAAGGGGGGAGIGVDTGAANASYGRNAALISQGEAQSRVNLDTTLANIDSQLQANNILSEFQQRQTQRQAQQQLQEANRSIDDQDRAADRRFIDLSFDAMPDTPDKELEQALENLRRQFEDETRDLTEFNESLGNTLVESGEYLEIIAQLQAEGFIPPEVANELISTLSGTRNVAQEAYDSSLAKLSQIGMLYQDLIDVKLEEALRAEAQRAFEFRQQSEGLNAEVGGFQSADLNRRGFGREAIDLDGEFQRLSIELDFDEKIRSLEEMGRIGQRTAEEVAELTAKYEELGHLQLQGLTRQLEDQREELKRTSDEQLLNSQTTLYDSIMKRYEIYGGSPSFDSDPFAEELAIAQQEINFDNQVRGLEDLHEQGKLTSLAMAEMVENLRMANDIELGNIRAQFDEWTPVINIARDSVQTLIGDFILGGKSIGEMFSGMLASAASALAQLAAQNITKGLFGSIINSGNSGSNKEGNSGVGGLFGTLLSTVFKFASGTSSVPRGDFSAYREGYGPISAALKAEGADSVLAALTPGERVLTVEENRYYPLLLAQAQRRDSMNVGAIANFKSGGVVGTAPPPLKLAPTTGAVQLGDINLTVGSSVDAGQMQDALISGLPKLVEAEIIRQKGVRGRLS